MKDNNVIVAREAYNIDFFEVERLRIGVLLTFNDAANAKVQPRDRDSYFKNKELSQKRSAYEAEAWSA